MGDSRRIYLNFVEMPYAERVRLQTYGLPDAADKGSACVEAPGAILASSKIPAVNVSPQVVTAEPSADRFDRFLHAGEARFTAYLSPVSSLLAYLDWALHLANAPARRFHLAQQAWSQWARLAFPESWDSARGRRSSVRERGLVPRAVQHDQSGVLGLPKSGGARPHPHLRGARNPTPTSFRLRRGDFSTRFRRPTSSPPILRFFLDNGKGIRVEFDEEAPAIMSRTSADLPVIFPWARRSTSRSAGTLRSPRARWRFAPN